MADYATLIQTVKRRYDALDRCGVGRFAAVVPSCLRHTRRDHMLLAWDRILKQHFL